jgi:hypothetical protein
MNREKPKTSVEHNHIKAGSINAKVAICKCPKTKGVFGIRFEERNGDWLRTWAFKIDEDKAKREGFDATKINGTMTPTTEYPGCPYCETNTIAPCSCGKIFCFPEWTGVPKEATCPWCGKTALYTPVEKIQVTGGGY